MKDDFAAKTIGTMLIILKERYTDIEICKMLTEKKIKNIIDFLNGENSE